ncbi:MAG: cell division protein FtsA, partial [Gemmatimonadota bacterium]
CAVIAAAGADGEVRVVGVGTSPTEGMRRGVVVDVEKTVVSIRRAVEEAEVSAGTQALAAWVGIAGEHIRSVVSGGSAAVEGRGHEVSDLDRERAIAAARTVAIPFDQQVLHVIPQGFALDSQEGILNPVGMCGVRLETSVYIVTGALTAVQNLCRSVERAGLEVRELALESLASSRSVLTDDERDMGVALMDLGGGTTDVAVYRGGSLRHTGVVGFGGQSVTNDVAVCVRTSWSNAESLKVHRGAALVRLLDGAETVEVPGVAGRAPVRVARSELAAIIEARMEEILVMARSEIETEAQGLSAGVVLTGGGALIEGAVELAEEVFQCPVRLGAPAGLGGLGETLDSPVYATAAGLVLLAADASGANAALPRRHGNRGGMGQRVRQWFDRVL